ncbi:hypothetical protein B0H14DRAFT_2575387 [Mycena olivaceomarginata]|nr:hypothetical protein B0H14DRAFT_2575387 [Mycena olivaceomarginata]
MNQAKAWARAKPSQAKPSMVGTSLERFQDTPAPPRNIGTSVHAPTGGRPRYSLDLNRAIELHDMGNTRTLYYHFERAGLSSERPTFTDIDDNMLDEKVVELSLRLLEARLFKNIWKHRIYIFLWNACRRESLRRVDTIGVIVRFYRVRGSNALLRSSNHGDSTCMAV